ncbi:MAG: 4Fe-4S binding protein [Myxococcales bacterium]|nr:4Fe-4S binding protein [Myxococcales bacterium]
MKTLVYSLRSMGIALKNAIRPPTTEGFGHPERVRPERYRNSFALVYEPVGENTPESGPEEACIGCRKCELICPSAIITVKAAKKGVSPTTGKKRGYLDDYTLDMNACIFCELCVQVCPTDAIVMCKEPTEPVFFREDLLLTKDKLYANEHLRKPAWATGAKLVDMQDPNRLSPEQQAAKDAQMAAAAAKKAELAAQKAAEEAKAAEEKAAEEAKAAEEKAAGEAKPAEVAAAEEAKPAEEAAPTAPPEAGADGAEEVRS